MKEASSQRPRRFLENATRLQVERPWRFLFVSLALAVVGLVLARRLEVRTGFESLLPEGRPSVVELRRVAAKTSGVSTLFVVLHGGASTSSEALRAAGDRMVAEIAKIGPPEIGSVEDGVHDGYRFLLPRSGLFADVNALKHLDDEVAARFAWEVGKQLGTNLDDQAPPKIDAKRVEDLFGKDRAERYPDGYYQSKDRKTLVVAIRSKVLATDFDVASKVLSDVKGAVARVDPKSFDREIEIGYAGDLYSGLAEYRAIMDDLTSVGRTGALLIAAVVFLYYLRLRTLLVMLATIGIGVSWTFGVTELAIGYLNVATSFLFTIVAGNGINFGILFMARYLEARRRGEGLERAIAIAHEATWVPTLTACLAASAAYASLATTEFRGFRDFGVIGSYGMVLCWIATVTTLPAILVVAERIAPLESETGILSRVRRFAEGGVHFGRPFARVVERAPRIVAASGLALAVCGAVALAFYVRSNPMEYDVKKLRNDLEARADEQRNKKLADEITGYVGADGMAILVDAPEDVAPLRAALYARRDAAPADAKPFDSIVALEDLVPSGQEEKIPILEELAARIERARKHKMLSDDDWNKIAPYLPPKDLAPFGMNDLPIDVARTFTEADGTRGRIVYIVPTKTDTTDDAHYLLRWAAAYRRTELPNGHVVIGSGRAVIYADMWSAVIAAVPQAVAVSFVATVLVVAAAFRGSRKSLLVLGALLVGVGWLGGLFVLLGVKLNFLNFVALPITFGIGVDYAVNIVERQRREGRGGALVALRETGGAVILCSLTTMLGYFALVTSLNEGVRSLGVAAVVGEITCLLAAVLVLPAFIVARERAAVASAAGTP